MLLDCGCTALVSMRRYGIEPNSIATVIISHLHGDHFGGLPFFLSEARHLSRRRDPLLIAGPAGTAARLEAATEVFYPGSFQAAAQAFPLEILELAPGCTRAAGAALVTPFEALHPSGAPSFILRVEVGGRIITYTGDTAWTEALIEAARGADLLIAEAFTFDRTLNNHLSHAVLAAQRERLGAAQIVLTHLGPQTLARLDEVQFAVASDGAVFSLG